MAISAATFQAYERVGVDRYRVRLTLTDNAKTPSTYDQWFVISGTTLQQLTDDASKQIAALAVQDSVKDVLAGITPGTAVPITYTPVVDPDATWLGQVGQLERANLVRDALTAHGGTPPTQFDTDYDTLATAVKNGYTTARGGKL